MKPNVKYLIPTLLAILLVSSVGPVFAQGQGVISAEVDRAALSTDETLTLTVMLNTGILSAPTPSLPALEGFNVVGSSTSSQISIVNGNITSQVLYVYRLQPYQAGDLVIEPVSVTLDGQTFRTEPIAVRVTQGSGAPPPAPSAPPVPAAPAAELTGQDLFVEAEVDDPAPYVGQQVIYTFRFYQAANLWDQPQYEAPAFTGFWSERTDQYDYRVQAAGRVYQVTEVQTILFPSVVGPVIIDPARLVVPGGFFSTGKTLQTRPVELDVQPLPPGAPDGFGGAVGQFALVATVDAAQGTVDEPLTWQVTLSGRGNITAAPDPVWPEMPGWRDFESQATVNTEIQDGRVAGNRVYERLLVPGAAGEFTIPALAYAYFDPIAGEYQVARTAPIPVSVAPGAAEAPLPRPAAGAGEPLEQVTADIRHLKPVPAELASARQPVTRSALYWAAWAFPALGAAGYFVWQRRQRFWENNHGLVRSAQARKEARKALARARRQQGDAYEAAGLILTTYLADKLDRPVAGLTHQALASLLAGRDVAPDLVERVEVLLVSSELGRYAPGADDPGHARSLLQEVGILVDALEKAL